MSWTEDGEGLLCTDAGGGVTMFTVRQGDKAAPPPSAKEEEDWSLLFQSLGGATAVAFAAAVADFVGSGGMDRGGMDAW